jgi:putative toxin-antitoxin system antitoxin component (TIGR02293 family)
MSMKPLAEAYEKLKERRRRGGLASASQSKAEATVAERDAEILSWLEIKLPRDVLNVVDDEASRARIFDILILADRVFSDKDKAEAWLNRPNTSLSRQKPADLLKDELGAAIVREMLERIDSGIFA